MPSNRSQGASGRSGRRNVNIFTENPIVSGPRNSRSKRKIVDRSSDEEDEEEEMEEEEEDDAGAGETQEEEEDDDDDDNDEDEDEEEDEEEDADADADADAMDEDADETPLPQRPPNNKLTSRVQRPRKSVEAKEYETKEEGDEETKLSELEPDDAPGEEEEEPDENETRTANANADTEMLDEENEDEDLDSDGTPSSTPDYNRLTKRQRGSLGGEFLQLPMGESHEHFYFILNLNYPKAFLLT